MGHIDHYEAVVVGATPGGIATAVRAAREGVETLLIADGDHVGGMMAGGLSYTDTLTKKARAPVLEEFLERVRTHYAETYGTESPQYAACEDGYVFEPSVAESVFEALVSEQPRLTLRRGHYPTDVVRRGRTIERVTLGSDDDGFVAAGEVFVDATYVGDLAALAGVPYRIGREPREEHGEQFAGRIFTQTNGDQYYPQDAVGATDADVPPDRRGPLDVPPEKRQGDLDLIPHPAGLTEIYPGSTGAGDDAIQAYNYRLCLSRDPDNRRLPEEPDGYDREEYTDALEAITTSAGNYVQGGLRTYLLLRYLPNDKADMNSADLPGENHGYPEANRERRAAIADRHRRYALGLLYFLQNDDAVPTDVRSEAREWGLAEDEFVDNENFPWELYVREARRIDGRDTFTEHDGRHAPGLDRAPVQADAIAIAEYPLDSHACHEEYRLGSGPEGNFYASQVTRPAQVPYGCLLPRGLDNLLVPVCLSATHVGYGMLRLEPTWMHVGEAAGHAAALAIEEDRPPAAVTVPRLQQQLAENDVMLTFDNGFDTDEAAPWADAVQFLGARGFFSDYDADPGAALTEAVADQWIAATAAWLTGREDPTERARAVHAVTGRSAITAGDFLNRLADACDREPPASDDVGIGPDDRLTRGEACRICYRVLTE